MPDDVWRGLRLGGGGGDVHRHTYAGGEIHAARVYQHEWILMSYRHLCYPPLNPFKVLGCLKSLHLLGMQSGPLGSPMAIWMS